MASGSLRRAMDLPDRIKLSDAFIVSSPVAVGAGSSAVTKSAEHAAGPNCPAQLCYQPERGVPTHRLPSDWFPVQPTNLKPTALGFIQPRISQMLRVHKDL